MVLASVALACLGLAAAGLAFAWDKLDPAGREPQAQRWDDPAPVTPDPGQFADVNTAFACDLYRELSRADKSNLIFSPFSVSAMMAQLYSGARGETREQIKRALHFDMPEEDLHTGYAFVEYDIEMLNSHMYHGSIANSIWVSPEVEITPAFKKLIKSTYHSQLIQLDASSPESAARINDWIALNTGGNLRDAYTPVAGADSLGLVCVNCLDYFGSWKYEERFGSAPDMQFYLDETRQVRVPAISHESRDQAAIGDGFTALRVTLEVKSADDYSFTVLLPDEPAGLSKLEEMLTPELLWELDDTLAWTDTKVTMPEVNFQKKADVVAALENLGVDLVFRPDEADLSGLGSAGLNPLYVKSVEHTALIRVNWRGVAASAATVVPVCYLKIMMPPEKFMEFTLDRPFIFFVRDEGKKLILFMGRVADPSERSGPEEQPLSYEEGLGDETGPTER